MSKDSKPDSGAPRVTEGKQDNDDKKKDDSTPSTATVKTVSTVGQSPFHTVVVHPLVLLSVVDHYTRVAKDTNKRVVGVLLGEVFKGKVDITNSYAVPFEEDAKEPNIWYLDRQYHEEMFDMFKKVNAREKVIGWYSTGPKIRPADLEVNEMFRDYTTDPVFVIIDVNPREDPLEIPTTGYVSVESKPEAAKESRRQFTHVATEVGAYEAEEVGVEHLLRNIKDLTESSLSDKVSAKLMSLRALHARLGDIVQYLTNVEQNKLPINHQIVYNLQDMFNLMPDLSTKQIVQSFATNTNDNMMVIYVSSLIRSIASLHDLILNKLSNRAIEIDEAKTPQQRAQEKKEKEEAEAKKKAEAEMSEADKKKGKMTENANQSSKGVGDRQK